MRLCSIAGLLLFLQSLPAQTQKSNPKEHLTQRVTAFYNALQRNQKILAQQFVVAKARPDFRNQQSGKFNSYKITNIELEKGRRSAIVEVKINLLIPSIVRPVDIPSTSRWKLIAGEWYMDPTDPPPDTADLFQKYYYDRIEKKLPSQLKFEQDKVSLGFVEKGATKTVKFDFANLSDKQIRIERVYLQSEYMKDLTKQKTIGPKEKGEIEIEVDTSKVYGEFASTLFVQFEPIQEMARLTVTARVYTAKDLSVYKKPEAQKAGDTSWPVAPPAANKQPPPSQPGDSTGEKPPQTQPRPDNKK